MEIDDSVAIEATRRVGIATRRLNGRGRDDAETEAAAVALAAAGGDEERRGRRLEWATRDSIVV